MRPIEPAARALGATLVDLGHVRPGAKVLVATARLAGTDGGRDPLGEGGSPTSVATVRECFREAGAEVDDVETHTLVPCDPQGIQPELGLLRQGAIDALCVASAEELTALLEAAREEAGDPSALVSLVVARGEETAAAAKALLPEAEVITIGARQRDEGVIGALEEHYGAGKLLF